MQWPRFHRAKLRKFFTGQAPSLIVAGIIAAAELAGDHVRAVIWAATWLVGFLVGYLYSRLTDRD